MNTLSHPPAEAEAEDIIDAALLDAEFNAVATVRHELHLTTAHLWYLALAAHTVAQAPDAPTGCREVLQDFTGWARKNAGFGPEMLKLLKPHKEGA